MAADGGAAGRPYESIEVRAAGAVTTLVLDRPARRNAIGPRMVGDLLDALAAAWDDPDVRVVVLTGAGAAFCAGGDFAQMSATGEGGRVGEYAELLLALVRAPKPVIARVNGAAFGGGLGLVAASTFAIASDAAELGTPEINVGIFPMMIMAVLARLVPRRKLLEMMTLGERLSADEALRLGLLNRVVPAERLDDEVASLAGKLATKSPTALRLGLTAYADQGDLALDDALPVLRERLAACLATDDAREGLTAFLEKRAPRWAGR